MLHTECKYLLQLYADCKYLHSLYLWKESKSESGSAVKAQLRVQCLSTQKADVRLTAA